MTDDPQFDWETTVSNTYAGVVGEADPDAGIGRQEAMEIATSRILSAIDSGNVKIDLADVVKRALLHADSRHGKRADDLIEATHKGLLTLFDSVDELNTVVTLGAGRRKLWRHINDDDLIAMDSARYKNIANAQDAYGRWRASFEPTWQKLRIHKTIEKGLAAGAFDGELA